MRVRYSACYFVEVSDVSHSVVELLLTSYEVEFGLTACEVKLAIAEMACVSRNVRRTFHVPSGVPVQRSISERDVSHPRMVYYFHTPQQC